mgnify:FL=1
MKKNEGAITRVVIATGVSSVVAQLLTIREFLAQLHGNEFVIALILFNWLVLGGIGTLFARFAARDFWQAKPDRLAWLSILLCCLPAIQIMAIRWLRDVFFVHGASVGFYQTLFYIFFTITPYSLILGFVLPYSLFVMRALNPVYPGTRMYLADNIGDVTGGALFSFVLVYLVSPMTAVFLSNLPLLISAYLLFPASRRNRLCILLLSGLSLVILLTGVIFETASLSPREGRLAFYRESRYGRIEVHQDQEQFTLYRDGSPDFSSQNLSMAEEIIHYPLSQIKDVRHVLLISAESGMMEELEKYRPERVDYVELDPQVTDIQFRFNLLKRLPGLNVIHEDGRAYLTGTDRIYDAIILNLPEPDTFQVNRFFTDQFFSTVRQHIRPNGVFSFSMEGFENYLSETQRRKLSCLFNTVSGHFSSVLLLPGQKVFFICSALPVKTDIPSLLAEKGIYTDYISRFYYGNVTGERIRRLNDLMDTDVPVNTDSTPGLIRLMFTGWFEKFSTSPAGFIVVLSAIAVIYLFRIKREEFVLFTSGCMVMGSEILVIFAFQIFFGYVYFQIGLIITVFLAGLFPGAWQGHRLRHRGRSILMLTDCLLIIFMATFILFIVFARGQLPIALFFIFGLLISFACGCQFPVVLYLRGDDNPAATRAFSADLIGAACGTLIASVFLIPYVGLVWTAVLLIALKLVSLIVVAASHGKNIQTAFPLL